MEHWQYFLDMQIPALLITIWQLIFAMVGISFAFTIGKICDWIFIKKEAK